LTGAADAPGGAAQSAPTDGAGASASDSEVDTTATTGTGEWSNAPDAGPSTGQAASIASPKHTAARSLQSEPAATTTPAPPPETVQPPFDPPTIDPSAVMTDTSVSDPVAVADAPTTVVDSVTTADATALPDVVTSGTGDGATVDQPDPTSADTSAPTA